MTQTQTQQPTSTQGLPVCDWCGREATDSSKTDAQGWTITDKVITDARGWAVHEACFDTARDEANAPEACETDCPYGHANC